MFGLGDINSEELEELSGALSVGMRRVIFIGNVPRHVGFCNGSPALNWFTVIVVTIGSIFSADFGLLLE